MSNPFLTDAKQLTVVELNLIPGNGHDLHKQPDQEKVICCVWGKLEQLLKDEQQIFCPGVPILIVADVVHASFNISEMDEDAKKFPIVAKTEIGATLNTVMSNSFGFGGTNAALIFEKV